MRLSALTIACAFAASLASIQCCSAASDANSLSPALGGQGCDESRPQFILRQDFTDIPTISCFDPADLKAALGARASYTYDDRHDASGLSLDGLAALNFQRSPDDHYYYVSTVAFGPFAQGAGSYTFATPSASGSWSGAVTAGAYVQFYLERPFIVDYKLPFLVRLRGGEATDSTNVRDGTAVFEFAPAFKIADLFGKALDPNSLESFRFGSPFRRNGLPTILFAPELELQYDTNQSGPLTYALFASHREAMRLGPLFALRLYEFDRLIDEPSPFRDFVARLALSETYHTDWDTLSNRRYYSWQTAVIYNLNTAGTYAVSTSYSLGDSESSGNYSRQAKVAFSAKF